MYSEQKQALAAELSFKHPAVLAVSGSAGSGKTALLAALLPVLKSRGLKVGVIREADDLRLPAETDRLHEAGAEVLDTEVVVDGNITTSYGLGGAIPFALELVRQLAGQAEADRIQNAIAYRH